MHSNWIYQNEPFESDHINDNFGFIYLITDIINDKLYIGRKNFFSLKKDTKKTTSKRKKRIRKESDWKSYYGSSSLIKESVKKFGPENFKREILLLCKSQGELNYNETKYLFKHNVLEDDRYYNDNIIGRYYSKNVKKYESSL